MPSKRKDFSLKLKDLSLNLMFFSENEWTFVLSQFKSFIKSHVYCVKILHMGFNTIETLINPTVGDIGPQSHITGYKIICANCKVDPAPRPGVLQILHGKSIIPVKHVRIELHCHQGKIKDLR